MHRVKRRVQVNTSPLVVVSLSYRLSGVSHAEQA